MSDDLRNLKADLDAVRSAMLTIAPLAFHLAKVSPEDVKAMGQDIVRGLVEAPVPVERAAQIQADRALQAAATKHLFDEFADIMEGADRDAKANLS